MSSDRTTKNVSDVNAEKLSPTLPVGLIEEGHLAVYVQKEKIRLSAR